MSWNEILQHEPLIEAFRCAAARGRLASTFLFVGPPGVGKRTFAQKLAHALLCEGNRASQLEPCGQCWSCVQMMAGTHPDLDVVEKPEGKSSIPLELLIGDREHRNREGLCHRLSLKPLRGRRKIAIVDDADHLNAEGANCLLKVLEEPPPGSIVILIGTSPQRQLPTIRSRSQIVRFATLSRESVAQLLLTHGLVEQPSEAAQLAELSGGSLQRARELAQPEVRQFRQSLLESLADPHSQGVGLAKTVGEFVDAAGKDAAARRARLRHIVGWAADFFQAAMRSAAGAQADGDPVIQNAVEIAVSSASLDAQRAATCLDSCLDALRHIDANANLSTLIDAWIDQLDRSRAMPAGA